MEKRIFTMALMLILAVCFCLALPNGAIAKDKPIKWKMSTAWSSSLDPIENDKYFVKLVHEMSNGRLQIKFHSGGEIVPATELMSAVQNNVLQLAGDWAGYWIGKDTAFNVLAGFPFAPSWMDYIAWIYSQGGLDVYNEIYGKYGIVYFPHAAMGPESGIYGRRGSKGFHTAEDFKGAKIRMAGRLQGYILKELGAAPINISPSEIYQSLERGLLDYAEWSMPQIDWTLSFHEVADQLNVPGWYQTGFVLGVMINKEAYEQLPKDLQAIVKYAAQATMSWSAGRSSVLCGVYTKKFLDKGMKVNVLDQASIDMIQRISYKGLLEEAQANPLYAKAAYLLFKTAQDSQPFREISEKILSQRKTTFPDLEPLKEAAGDLLKE